MYSVYSKDGLLLHLGQEHSVGKVISCEYIFITNMLTVIHFKGTGQSFVSD